MEAYDGINVGAAAGSEAWKALVLEEPAFGVTLPRSRLVDYDDDDDEDA